MCTGETHCCGCFDFSQISVISCWSSGLDTNYFIQYLEKIVQKWICLWFQLKRHSIQHEVRSHHVAQHFLYHLPKVIQLNIIRYSLLKKTVGLRISLVSNYAKRYLLVFEQFGCA